MSRRILSSDECRWLVAAHVAGSAVMLAVLLSEPLTPLNMAIAAALGLAMLSEIGRAHV